MALVGIPQYLAVRSYTWSGSGTSEVDEAAINGQDKLNGGAGSSPFAGSSLSKTITAGPTTSGPIIVIYQGVVFALPFNVSCSVPLYVWNCLDSTVWTYA